MHLTNEFIKTKYEYKYTCIDSQKKVLNVAFNINNDYSMQAGVVITSAVMNSKGVEFSFHVFTDSIDEENRMLFCQLAEQCNISIYIYVVNMNLFQGFGAEKTRFKSVSLFRVCMNDVLSKVTDRFLYLDADVVCLGDLSIFFDVKLDENIVAAVPDLVRNRLEIWGIKDRTYFNSGVLLVSCKNWEKYSITEKALSFKGCNDPRVGFPDQDILNIVIEGKVKYLDKKYNFFGFYGTSLESDCVIYHYIGREKPWNIAIRDVEKKWRYYLSKTPWPNLEDELPRKVVKNYFYFKSAAVYFLQHGNFMDAIKCYYWYAWLKMCNHITIL